MSTAPDLELPSAPRDLTVEVLNSTSLAVTWRPPETPQGLLHYLLYYMQVGGGW